MAHTVASTMYRMQILTLRGLKEGWTYYVQSNCVDFANDFTERETRPKHLSISTCVWYKALNEA